jgi:hypothetical protein
VDPKKHIRIIYVLLKNKNISNSWLNQTMTAIMFLTFEQLKVIHMFRKNTKSLFQSSYDVLKHFPFHNSINSSTKIYESPVLTIVLLSKLRYHQNFVSISDFRPCAILSKFAKVHRHNVWGENLSEFLSCNTYIFSRYLCWGILLCPQWWTSRTRVSNK